MKSNRRFFLAALAGIASGSIPRTTVADDPNSVAIDSDDSSEESRIREIDVFGSSKPKIPENHKVIHSFGWKTEPRESKHDLERIRDIPDYEFKIDGERIENPHQYWKPIQNADYFHRVRWEYAAPPEQNEVGTHSFEVIIDFGDSFEPKSLDNGNTWAGQDKHVREYEVITEQDFKRNELSEALDTVENELESREKELQNLRAMRDLAEGSEDSDIDIAIDSTMTDITILTSRKETLETKLQRLNQGSL